jgi:putative peptidoglycan lipid II flippase
MTERLARSAGLIGAATLASRVLGMVRDSVFAKMFGATPAMDAFNMATRIPNLLRDLFAEGAMSAAFVPTFTRYVTQHGKEAGWRLGSQVVNALLIITGALVLLGIVFADPFMHFYAGKFAAVPGKLELTTQLTRVTMPFLALVAIAAAYMGMLNALRRFFMPSLSPAVFNVAMIATGLVLHPVFTNLGWPPIMSLAVGTLVGGLAQAVIQIPTLRREGYRHQWVLDPSDRGLREVLLLMGPGTLGVAAAQINLFVNSQLASSQDGAVSWLNYAFRLMYMPIGIFGVSVATAAVPELARHAARGAHGDMRTTLSSGLRLMLMLSVPSFVGLVALAGPIVELFFQRGEFVARDTRMVASALLLYSPGLVGYSIVKLASPTFYALRDARTPVIVSVVTVLSNLALNLWLVRIMQFQGLALGTAIAANINAGLLLFLLSKRIGGLDTARVMRSFVKISIASAVMGVMAWWTEAWLHGLFPGQWIAPRALRVGGSIGVAMAVLAVMATVLRIEEFRQAMGRVLKKFG